MSVSILMPVHGKSPFLVESVISVTKQNIDSWELIIVLDRPTPELNSKVGELVILDQRIRKLVSPGSGIVDALNFGLSHTSWDLVARLDSDDLMEPERLYMQQQHLLLSPKLACLGTQMMLIDEFGKFIGRTFYPNRSSKIRKHLKFQNCIGHPSVMYRKKMVYEVGGYRKVFTGVEDYDLWLRLSKKFDIENLENQLTKYRISPGQYSKTFGNKYTYLEEAARLDSIFSFMRNTSGEYEQADSFKSELLRIRRKNFISHPLKVIMSYQGYLVSRIIRILSGKSNKPSKLLRSIPFGICLFLISPKVVVLLFRSKIKGRSK